MVGCFFVVCQNQLFREIHLGIPSVLNSLVPDFVRPNLVPNVSKIHQQMAQVGKELTDVRLFISTANILIKKSYQYSKTCPKWSLKRRPKICFQDR